MVSLLFLFIGMRMKVKKKVLPGQVGEKKKTMRDLIGKLQQVPRL